MTSNSISPTVASNPAARGNQTIWFILLWIVWAVLLGGAMALGNLGGGHGGALPTAARMGSSVTLVATAWLAYFLWHTGPARRVLLCLAIGMTLGTVGDFFNAGWLDYVPVLHGTLGGIAAFGLGHIAYITGAIDLGRRADIIRRSAMLAAVLAWQLVGLVGWYFVVMLGEENRDLVWPALPYSLLLAGTAGVTSGLALVERRLGGLALGAALFLASDLILAFGLFRGHFSHQTEAVWLTYGPGQMLIVFSALSVVALLGRRGSD
jgi:YhhN-like protein